MTIKYPWLTVVCMQAVFLCAQQLPSKANQTVNFGTELNSLTLENALTELQTRLPFVVVGFEQCAHSDHNHRISFQSGEQSLVEVLASLHESFPDYSFALKQGTVDVRPIVPCDPYHVLDYKLQHFDYSGRTDPANLINNMIPNLPGFRAYLSAAQGISTPRQDSAAGSLLSGNMDPKLDIHLSNVTVRDLLWAVSHASTLNQNQPQPHPTPTGWVLTTTFAPGSPKRPMYNFHALGS